MTRSHAMRESASPPRTPTPRSSNLTPSPSNLSSDSKSDSRIPSSSPIPVNQALAVPQQTNLFATNGSISVSQLDLEFPKLTPPKSKSPRNSNNNTITINHNNNINNNNHNSNNNSSSINSRDSERSNSDNGNIINNTNSNTTVVHTQQRGGQSVDTKAMNTQLNSTATTMSSSASSMSSKNNLANSNISSSSATTAAAGGAAVIATTAITNAMVNASVTHVTVTNDDPDTDNIAMGNAIDTNDDAQKHRMNHGNAKGSRSRSKNATHLSGNDGGGGGGGGNHIGSRSRGTQAHHLIPLEFFFFLPAALIKIHKFQLNRSRFLIEIYR